jgi:DNA-binding GntR family transcriptional regulator
MSTQRRVTPKTTTTPKHAQLRESLRMQIESLRPDQPIPSEYELCAQYEVSRITVR